MEETYDLEVVSWNLIAIGIVNWSFSHLCEIEMFQKMKNKRRCKQWPGLNSKLRLKLVHFVTGLAIR